MSRITIPEKIVVTCDSCGSEYDPNKTTDYQLTAKLQVNSADFSGHYVGGHTRDIDLCGACSKRFATTFIKE